MPKQPFLLGGNISLFSYNLPHLSVCSMPCGFFQHNVTSTAGGSPEVLSLCSAAATCICFSPVLYCSTCNSHTLKKAWEKCSFKTCFLCFLKFFFFSSEAVEVVFEVWGFVCLFVHFKEKVTKYSFSHWSFKKTALTFDLFF